MGALWAALMRPERGKLEKISPSGCRPRCTATDRSRALTELLRARMTRT